MQRPDPQRAAPAAMQDGTGEQGQANRAAGQMLPDAPMAGFDPMRATTAGCPGCWRISKGEGAPRAKYYGAGGARRRSM